MKTIHPDHAEYYGFTGRSRLNKAVNTLLGVVEGISADAVINEAELDYLLKWLSEYRPFMRRHPFNELIPVVSMALEDNVLTLDEREDIIFLCEKLRSTDYFDEVTADIQRLHAILGALAADGVITKEELVGLSEWMSEHDHLRRCWPYDEVDSVITGVLTDGKIDEKEQEFLLAFFSEFVSVGETRSISRPPVSSGSKIQGLCAVAPEIAFKDSLFCFTGASKRFTRRQFENIILELGGHVLGSVTKDLDYLVIGAAGNPCWAYACYGRKVEKAVGLRKEGCRLLLVHENDFHDAVEDAR